MQQQCSLGLLVPCRTRTHLHKDISINRTQPSKRTLLAEANRNIYGAVCAVCIYGCNLWGHIYYCQQWAKLFLLK